MQDRFKFRCWHKKRKKMYEILHLHVDSQEVWATAKGFNIITEQDMHISIQPKDCLLMQSTGLKDKNSKLIYEGDILNVNTGSRDTSGCGVVEYSQSGCNYHIRGYLENPSGFHPRKMGEFCRPLQEWLYIEVIGNIYENPELLEIKA